MQTSEGQRRRISLWSVTMWLSMGFLSAINFAITAHQYLAIGRVHLHREQVILGGPGALTVPLAFAIGAVGFTGCGLYLLYKYRKQS